MSSTVAPKLDAVHFATGCAEWLTPLSIIIATLLVLKRIDLDPCSNTGTPNIPARKHFTVADDGLTRPWSGRLYVNPPYGREIGPWVRRLKSQYERGNVCQAIALLPSRTETAWFRAQSLDQIGLPSNGAIQFNGRQCATLEVRKHGVAIGGRRGIASRAIAMLTRVLGAKRRAPAPD